MATIIKLSAAHPDNGDARVPLSLRDISTPHTARSIRHVFTSRSGELHALLTAPIEDITTTLHVEGFFAREIELRFRSPDDISILVDRQRLLPVDALRIENGDGVLSFEIPVARIRDETDPLMDHEIGRINVPSPFFPVDFSIEQGTIWAPDDPMIVATGPRSFGLNAHEVTRTPDGTVVLLRRPHGTRPELIAVWIPTPLWNDLLHSRTSVDYCVFLHPLGNGDDPAYPTGIRSMSLIQRYLLQYSYYADGRMSLAYQLTHARKKTILVFPVGTPTALGEVESADGLYNVLEQIHAALLRKVHRPFALLRIGSVAVAGWSFGGIRVGRLLRSLRMHPDSKLHEVLTEIYLLDPTSGLRGQPGAAMNAECRFETKHWFHQSPRHRLRVYTKFLHWNLLVQDETARGWTHSINLQRIAPVHDIDAHGIVHTPRLTLLVKPLDFFLPQIDIDRTVGFENTQVPGVFEVGVLQRDTWVHTMFCRYFMSHAFRHSTHVSHE